MLMIYNSIFYNA